MPIPGTNVFISREDVTTEPSAEGYRTITCQPISGLDNARAAVKGINILRRLLTTIPFS